MPAGAIRFAHIDFMPGLRHYPQSRGTEHGHNAGMIGNPPVGRIAGEIVFNERHLWPSGMVERFPVPEGEIHISFILLIIREREGLKYHQFFCFLRDPILGYRKW